MSTNDDQVYAAPEAELHDETTLQDPDSELAGRGTRLGAVILDTIIAILFYIPGIVIMSMSGYEFDMDPENQMGLFIDIIMYAGVFVLAYMIINGIMLYKYGQTIAKRLLKIKIVRSDGSRVGAGRMFGLRIIVIQAIYQIPFVGFLFMLVNVLFIFREDQRCIHDLIADTKVIDAD